MSFFDNARRAFSNRIDEFYDDDREDYEDYENEYEETPRKPLFSFFKRDEDEYEEERPVRRTPVSHERYTTSYETHESYDSYRAPRPKLPNPQDVKLDGAEIAVYYPDGLRDSAQIIRAVKANRITVFDISTITSDEEARRIVDYIGGAAEGMDCEFKRLCPSVFCIAPKGVRFDIKKKA